MKHFTLYGMLAGAALLACAAAAHGAATVRGRVVHARDQSAAAGYKVTVANRNSRTTPAQVGADGMYYIYNVEPGSYDLEIWVPQRHAPEVYRIRVIEPHTDVPQVAVP